MLTSLVGSRINNSFSVENVQQIQKIPRGDSHLMKAVAGAALLAITTCGAQLVQAQKHEATVISAHEENGFGDTILACMAISMIVLLTACQLFYRPK